jgi:hypothetical protein
LLGTRCRIGSLEFLVVGAAVPVPPDELVAWNAELARAGRRHRASKPAPLPASLMRGAQPSALEPLGFFAPNAALVQRGKYHAGAPGDTLGIARSDLRRAASNCGRHCLVCESAKEQAGGVRLRVWDSALMGLVDLPAGHVVYAEG